MSGNPLSPKEALRLIIHSALSGLPHTKDSDCTLHPESDSCMICGAYHGYKCPQCGGRGFCVAGCDKAVGRA